MGSRSVKVHAPPLVGREALGRPILKTERVRVPEWEGDILLREMSAAQTTEFAKLGAAAQHANGDGPDLSMRLACWALVTCWVDADNKQVLGEEDIDYLLDTQPTELINRLAIKAVTISGMAAEAIASAEKNLEGRQNKDSGTS